MHSIYAIVAALLLLLATNTAAVTTTSVVDIPTRGKTIRILYILPGAPTANVLLIPGGTGFLDIRSDGTMPSVLAGCNPAVRNRQTFADSGYAVAVVDAASDLQVGNYADLVEVINYMQARNNVPTWVIGGSTQSEPTLDLVINLPLTYPMGAVFYSPEEFTAANGAFVKRPSLVIYHSGDLRQSGNTLFSNLTAAPVKEQVVLTGGNISGCAGYHTLNGLDAPFVASVNGFIARNNSSLVATPPAGTALAVEFYHAALDHYFLTHNGSEIALLDAGTTIKGWARTGQSFNVFTGMLTGTSPVCRYYIPPGKGDSHFYGRGTAECTATGSANPTFVNEDPQFFHVVLPVAGVCPASTRNVYRVFSNRADANHRYMVDRAIRDTMAGMGWLVEGDGPDLVVMCSPI